MAPVLKAGSTAHHGSRGNEAAERKAAHRQGQRDSTVDPVGRLGLGTNSREFVVPVKSLWYKSPSAGLSGSITYTIIFITCPVSARHLAR